MKTHRLTACKGYILYIWMFLLSPYIYGQPFLSFDSISNRLQKQRELSPQEKIYVHTDKPHYVCGEKIWFRAYLVDAFTHQTASGSKFVYAELISPANNVVARVKIKAQEDAFAGYMQLADSLAEGNYTFRAYTSLMCGSPEDYFFKKNIYISNPLLKSMKAQGDFEKDGNKIKARIHFTDLFKNKRIQPYRIYVTLDQDTIDFKWKDKDSLYQASFCAPDKGKMLTVRTGNFRQYIPIPDFNEDFDVSFFPEGGYLISGKLCRVGFKALASDGWSAYIKGELYDNDNRLICTFTPYYKGMGDFYFRPRDGKQYYAVCRDAENRIKRFELPLVSSEACVLKAVQNRKEITVGIQHSDLFKYEHLTLIAHSRGEIYYAAEWNKKKEYIRFKKKMFPSGIIQFLLVDSEGNPLSERLVFCQNNDRTETTITTDKKEYDTRELITVKVKVRDKDNKPVTGNFSVSVTDNGVVREDTCTSIYSSLLLSSELRGNIEAPDFYFKKDNRLAATALDALMLTQGWRRYDVPEVIKGNYAEPESTLEIGQEISGTVLSNLRRKPVKGSQVAMASLDKKLADITITDEKGKFSFNGFEFPDSTSFFVRALTKKGGEYVELKMDKDLFPKTTTTFIKKEWFPASLEDYTNKTANKISMENGIKHIWLDEVVKTAPKKLPPIDILLADNFFSAKRLEESGVSDLLSVLRRVSGVAIEADKKIRIRKSLLPPLVLIDGIAMNDPYFEAEEFDYKFINFSDIEDIAVIKNAGTTVLWGYKAAGGIISIHTKRGFYTQEKAKQYNSTVIHPLGYQKTIEFYSPLYTTKEPLNSHKTDLRTTIYWNPSIKLSKSGEATFSFYSADFGTDYSIKIEGINGINITESYSSIKIVFPQDTNL